MQAEQPCNFHNIAARRLWKSETSNISVAATIEWVACSHPDRGATLLCEQQIEQRALRIGVEVWDYPKGCFVYVLSASRSHAGDCLAIYLITNSPRLASGAVRRLLPAQFASLACAAYREVRFEKNCGQQCPCFHSYAALRSFVRLATSMLPTSQRNQQAMFTILGSIYAP
jgi:hypothetical protein